VALAFVVLIIIAVVYGFLQTPSNQPQTTYARAGSPAPDFTLPIVNQNGLTGERLTLSQFRGKIVVLEFMVSTCIHCQNMVPTVQRLQQEYGQYGVVVISVAATWNNADAASTAQFMKTHGATWVHVLDQKNSVFNTYQVESTPTYFIIDSQGVIQTRLSGEQTLATFAEILDRMLKR
jgi:peroxiredoxin